MLHWLLFLSPSGPVFFSRSRGCQKKFSEMVWHDEKIVQITFIFFFWGEGNKKLGPKKMTTKSFTYMCCAINDFGSNWSEMCLAGQISGLPFTGEHLSSISSLPLPGIVLEWVFILRTYFIREIAKTENRKETTMETNRFSFLERKWVYAAFLK